MLATFLTKMPRLTISSTLPIGSLLFVKYSSNTWVFAFHCCFMKRCLLGKLCGPTAIGPTLDCAGDMPQMNSQQVLIWLSYIRIKLLVVKFESNPNFRLTEFSRLSGDVDSRRGRVRYSGDSQELLYIKEMGTYLDYPIDLRAFVACSQVYPTPEHTRFSASSVSTPNWDQLILSIGKNKQHNHRRSKMKGEILLVS